MAENSQTLRRVPIAAIAFGTFAMLGVIPAAAALADDEALYGSYGDYDPDGPTALGIGIVSDTDATLTPLPQTLPLAIDLRGIEIVGNMGYGVGTDVEGTQAVFRWDVATGELLNTFAITTSVADATIDDVSTLTATEHDPELPDGTLITVVDFAFEEGANEVWVGSVDPLSGAFAPLVDITSLHEQAEDVDDAFYEDSLASDPTTGTTYLFADYDEGQAFVVPLDLNTGTIIGALELSGIEDSVDPFYVAGADFDSDGILWFNYQASPSGLAKTDGPFSSVVTATFVGPLSEATGAGGREQFVDELAIGPAPVPQLAATGAPVEHVLLSGLALLAVGGLVVVVTRRRAVPTA